MQTAYQGGWIALIGPIIEYAPSGVAPPTDNIMLELPMANESHIDLSFLTGNKVHGITKFNIIIIYKV